MEYPVVASGGWNVVQSNKFQFKINKLNNLKYKINQKNSKSIKQLEKE